MSSDITAMITAWVTYVVPMWWPHYSHHHHQPTSYTYPRHLQRITHVSHQPVPPDRRDPQPLPPAPMPSFHMSPLRARYVGRHAVATSPNTRLRYIPYINTTEGSRYIFLPMEVHADGSVLLFGTRGSWSIETWDAATCRLPDPRDPAPKAHSHAHNAGSREMVDQGVATHAYARADDHNSCQRLEFRPAAALTAAAAPAARLIRERVGMAATRAAARSAERHARRDSARNS